MKMSSNEDGDTLLDGNKDQNEIRKELSQMSFENLQKLKEKLGTKVYNATVFGVQKTNITKFKRENKNRPREESTKKQVSRFREVVPIKKKIIRDPRFDRLCGTFNEKAFKNSYAFLTKVKENDLKKLQEELNEEEDPKKIKKIKYLIQRLKNQLTAEKRKDEQEEKKIEEKQEIITAIKSGEKPNFKKKSEKRFINLVSQFEELKKSGKLKKHIQRVRRKNIRKDRVRLENSASE